MTGHPEPVTEVQADGLGVAQRDLLEEQRDDETYGRDRCGTQEHQIERFGIRAHDRGGDIVRQRM